MSFEGLGDLIEEVRRARDGIDQGDARTHKRIDGIEASVNELFKKVSRPGVGVVDDGTFERKSAIELCYTRRNLTVPKNNGSAASYVPAPSEIDEALIVRKALRNLFRHGDPARLDPTERKSLTSFSFGTNAFILAPEMSNTVLSCLVDPTDLAGMMNTVNISSGSIKFLIDNVRMQDSAWACESSCFANNPQADLQDGLGELEIKAETIRHIVCAGSDLIQDASFDIESWMLQKVSQGFRNTINNAIIAGDGIGKPMGILNPHGGIPICDVSPVTPPGQFDWRDLIMLKWEIPVQWHTGAAYLMNQRSFALLLTMSDASGRPIMIANPTEPGQFLINGSPVVLASQMPDCEPGATPVAFGGWKQAYTIVNRRATTIVTDPFSAGWCVLYKVDARVGGAPTCPNAARLLRVK